jgi:hypothetical protein
MLADVEGLVLAVDPAQDDLCEGLKAMVLDKMTQVFRTYLNCNCLLSLSLRESGHLFGLFVNPVFLVLSRQFINVGVKNFISFEVKGGGNTAIARIEGQHW